MTITVHRPKVFDTKLLLLTGAGASKLLGMPLMRDFYDLVIKKSDEAQRELLRDIFVVHQKETRRGTPDLEALLALIERYRRFYNILFEDERFGFPVDDKFKKHVEEWKEDVAEEKKRAEMEAKGLLKSDVGYLSPASARVMRHPNNTVRHQANYGSYLEQAYLRKGKVESLDTLLRNLIFEVYAKDLDDRKLDELYSPLFEVIGIHFPQDFIPIFTTNYDTAIEAYAGRSGIHLETGFAPTTTGGTIWKSSRFDQFRPRKSRQNIVLFKLHGSLAWHRKDNTIISTGLPIRDPSGYKSVVIYPTQTKEFPDEEPFRTMYSFLKGCLIVAKLAIVIGYSFRDPGIRRIMDEALDRNPSLRFVLVCGPNVDRWKKFARQKQKTIIIPHYFALSGGEHLEKLDAALAKLKS